MREPAAAPTLSPLSLLFDGPPLFEGCTHSYLDMGTNEGRRFDILLEPEKRPRQGIYTFFGKQSRRELCVVGFEPNPSHAPKLSRQMPFWRSKARVFHIFGAAISGKNAEAPFWSDGARKQREWGASLLNYNPKNMRGVQAHPESRSNRSHVQTISLDWFLRRHVIPAGSNAKAPTRMLAKMDIEVMPPRIPTRRLPRATWPFLPLRTYREPSTTPCCPLSMRYVRRWTSCSSSATKSCYTRRASPPKRLARSQV